MPSRNGTLALVFAALLYAAWIWALSAFVLRGMPWWLAALVFLLTWLSWVDMGPGGSFLSRRRRREREIACYVREVPGGGAGLSGRWRSAVVVPSYQRLSITGHAADRPPVSHLTWDEPIDEGLVQLRNVVEVGRRDPTLPEALRFGPRTRIMRCQADDAVLEIAAPEYYLGVALRLLKDSP